MLGWYSLIHLAASELPDAVAALARPLAPGGWLVLGMHAGSDVPHFDEWFEQPDRPRLRAAPPRGRRRCRAAAGLVDVEWYLRSPFEGTGETTQRLYVVGRAPA